MITSKDFTRAFIVSMFLSCFPGAWPVRVYGQQEEASSVSFSEVRTVFRKRCMTCHNPEEARGDLDLSSLKTIEVGAGSGPVIVPGNPNASLLYTVTAHLEEPVMPPNSAKIPGRELDLLKRWIEGLSSQTDEMQQNNPASSTGDDKEPHDSDVAQPAMITSAETSQDSDLREVVSIKGLLATTSVNTLAVHPSKPIFATSGRGQVVIGNHETREWIGAIDFPEGEVTTLRFSRDGETLLAGGGVAGLSGTVLGIEVKTGDVKFQLADELDTILAVDMTNNGRLLAVGGPKKMVRIYSIDSGEILHTLRKHTDWVLDLEFSPDGILLASSDRFGGVFVWNPSNGEIFHTLAGHQGMVSDIAWDDSGENLITGCDDRKLRVWNMHHGELTVAWDAGVGSILSIDYRVDNRTLVGGRDKKANWWTGPESLKGSITIEDQVTECAFSADQETALLGDSQGIIRIIDLEGGNEVGQMRLPVETDEAAFLMESLAKADLQRKSIALSQIDKPSSRDRSFNVERTDKSDTEDSLGRFETTEDHSSVAVSNVDQLLQSFVVNFDGQQEILAEITRLKLETESNLAALVTLEATFLKTADDQRKNIDELRNLVESIKTSSGPERRLQQLEQQLQMELSVMEKGTEILGTLENDTSADHSTETNLLRNFQTAIRNRIELTTAEIQNLDSPKNAKEPLE